MNNFKQNKIIKVETGEDKTRAADMYIIITTQRDVVKLQNG